MKYLLLLVLMVGCKHHRDLKSAGGIGSGITVTDSIDWVGSGITVDSVTYYSSVDFLGEGNGDRCSLWNDSNIYISGDTVKLVRAMMKYIITLSDSISRLSSRAILFDAGGKLTVLDDSAYIRKRQEGRNILIYDNIWEWVKFRSQQWFQVLPVNGRPDA